MSPHLNIFSPESRRAVRPSLFSAPPNIASPKINLMSLINLFSHHALGNPLDVCGSGLSSIAAGICPHLGSHDSQLPFEPKSWSPWTHRPYCQGDWCVHTHALVPCGQGISIITHHSREQEAAETLASLGHDFDMSGCSMGAGSQDSTSDDNLRGKDDLYEVRDSKGKGKGVFATRSIPRGTIIMIDHPIMLKLEPDIEKDVSPGDQRSLLFDQAATQLSNPDQVLGLAQHEDFTGSMAENAANYNSFQIDLDNGTYSAVFPRVSRINHACIPNSRAKWSSKNLSQTIWTVKDVQPGEELSISCKKCCGQNEDCPKTEISLTGRHVPDIPMGPNWKWQHRQDELRENWNFACMCALCSAGPRKREASDERRRKFAALAQEYHHLHHYDTEESQKAFQILEKAMEINIQEPMLTSATPLLLQAAWTAYRGRHIGMARRYVERAEEDMRARAFEDEGDRSSLNEIRRLIY